VKIFQKQAVMRRVLYSLVPIFLFSIYLYGWRSIALTGMVFLFGIATEYFYTKSQNKKVSEAVLVTCGLYSLSLPPLVPFWIAAVGIIFAILIAKSAFGGFGRNIFNPAIAGRLFVYIAFPNPMTTEFVTAGNFGLDAVTTATPLDMMREGLIPSIKQLLFGIRAGSLGESAIILIILAGIYLVATKTANWKVILATLVSFFGFSALFWYFGGILGARGAVPPLEGLLSGSILFVAVFMATDPITAPNKPGAQWLYGILIGTMVVLVRSFSLFSEGTSFAILMANTFASLMDEWFTPKKKDLPKKAEVKS
jgi:Na+-transporting NADH:ubiquinone oxidoreductase subunit B